MLFLEISLLPIGGKKEKETYQTLKELSHTVVKTVEKLQKGVKEYSKQNYEGGKDFFHEVDQLESKADKVGLNFELELGKGAFLPAYRGDLSRLAESIDDTADQAEETIREIDRRTRLFDELSEAEKENEEIKSIRKGLVELVEKAVLSARSQDEAVSILMDDMDKAGEKAEEIHRREHDSDELEDKLTREIYRYEDILNPITVLQAREVIDKIGSISDSAENTGDILSAMVNALKA